MIPKRKNKPAAKAPYLLPTCGHCRSDKVMQISGSLQAGTAYFKCDECGLTTKAVKLTVEDVLNDFGEPT